MVGNDLKNCKIWENCSMYPAPPPPPEMKILRFGKKNELFFWEKIGKGANQVKLAILSQSEPLFVGKVGN